MINLVGKEYLLTAVLKHCQDVVTIKDLKLRYLAYNDSFLRVLGLDENCSLAGKSIYEILSPESCQIIEQNLRQVISTLETRSYTFSLQVQGINRVFKQTSTPIVHDGVLERILSVSYEVTQEESLRAQLIEKNEQMRTLLESLPVLVFMKDKDRNLIVTTKASKDFVLNGYDKFADIKLDMSFSEAETANEDNYVLENKKLLIKEKSAKDFNGKKHWYRVYKAPILTENNEANGIVAIVVNINQEKEAENQKNLFLAALTHDLKNPLQAQISTLEMFGNGLFGELNETQKEMLDMVVESSKYMRSMLYSLMQTCKDNNGVIFLKKNVFDIEDLIKKCIAEVTNWGLTKGIKIKFESSLKDKDKNFYADEVQIRRVVGNLLNNGLNYSFSNGEIIVRLKKSKDGICISVTNTSDEIPDDMINIIFDKYVCGKNLQSNINVGLGLYFCKKVVEAHQGKISLDANKNLNTFIVELPVLDESTGFISEIVL